MFISWPALLTKTLEDYIFRKGVQKLLSASHNFVHRRDINSKLPRNKQQFRNNPYRFFLLQEHCNKQNVGSLANLSPKSYYTTWRTTSTKYCCPVLKPILSNSQPLTMASPPEDNKEKFSTTSSTNESSSSSSTSPKPKFLATKEELKARLSPIQYQVTQLKSTERPFTGEYNKFNKKGTYYCVVCDEELFKSDTKFESGCGWPAFFDTIDKDKLKFVQDYSLVGAGNLLRLANNPDLIRTEVLCKNCDAHLGHRFDDGPLSKGGKRYCINSAALKFRDATTFSNTTDTNNTDNKC